MLKRSFASLLTGLGLILFSMAIFSATPKVSNPVRKSITTVKPPDFTAAIHVTAPTQGVHWRVGTEKAILWSADPARVGPNVRILLLKAQQVQNVNGQQAQKVIKESWPSGSSGYSWKITENIAPGEYRIVVQSTSNGVSGSSKPFLLVPQPTFTIIQPAANSTWQAGKTYTVKWSYSGDAVGPLGLILFCSGGNHVDNIPLNGDGGSRTFQFPVSANANAGMAVLFLIEKNPEAALANDLIGYRGVNIPLTIVK